MSVDVVVLDAVRVVRTLVLRQMVASHELLAAVIARETLLAGMGTTVALEFVASRESLHTMLPVTRERLVSSVSAEMGSQMRRLSVGLLTEVANVNARFSVALSRILHTVRAGTRASLRRLSTQTRRVHIVVRRHHHRVVVHLMLHLLLLGTVDRWIPSLWRRRWRSVVRDDPFLRVVGILLEVKVTQRDPLLSTHRRHGHL